LENFNGYDEERQGIIEQWLEEIMTEQSLGLLVRQYFWLQCPDWELPEEHQILRRFYCWLVGIDRPVSSLMPLGGTRILEVTNINDAVWKEEGIHYAPGLPWLDLEQAMILREGREIPLTPLENSILNLLYQARGRVVTHRRFEEWAQSTGDKEGCYEPKHHIRHLREKLGDNLKAPVLISNRRGIGYCLNPLIKAINV